MSEQHWFLDRIHLKRCCESASSNANAVAALRGHERERGANLVEEYTAPPTRSKDIFDLYQEMQDS